LAKCQARLEFYQKKLSRQQIGSKRREQTKRKIANIHQHMANIRKDFAHKTMHTLVNSANEIFVLEDLKVKNMTASLTLTIQSRSDMDGDSQI
jgi:putative transposase